MSPDATSSSAALLEQREGAVVTLTMSNPGKLNAMSAAIRDALTAAFSRLNADPQCRAIILTGAERQFSAGADMAGWNESTVQECRTRLKHGGSQLVREMVAGSKPIIAAVEGHAFGAGLALACAADHIVASRAASFCCAFTRVGFIPDMGLMFTLPNRVGVTRARQLIALAEAIDSERAERIGLIDELTAEGGALTRARALALQYAEAPPLAFELMKSALARGLEAMSQAEIDLQPYAWLSQDHVEGKRAFREKRKPRFTGR